MFAPKRFVVNAFLVCLAMIGLFLMSVPAATRAGFASSAARYFGVFQFSGDPRLESNAFSLSNLVPQACAGTSTNMTCSAAGPISLNSTTGSPQNPQRAGIYPSNNAVSGMTGTITSVAVRFNGLSHDWLHDIDAVLISPTGQPFVFWSDIGIALNGGQTIITNQTLTITDTAATNLPQGATTNNTSYRPRNYETAAHDGDGFPSPATVVTSPSNSAAPFGSQTFSSRFNGLNPNGTWQLYMALDSSGPDTGSLQSWDLIITTQATNLPTSTTLTSSANPAVIPLSGNSTGTITATVTAAGNPVTSGFVSFFEGSTALATNVPVNASGQASFTFNTVSGAPTLGEGVHPITANYSGATGFGASNGNLTQTVDRATQVTGNTFCNTGKITIPAAIAAANIYPSKLFVSGLSGNIQSVVMEIRGFTNPAPDDVNLLLVSPTGQKFVPFAYVSDFINSQTTNANITLDDLSANALPNSGPIASGTYRPSHGLNGNGVTPVTFVSPAPAGPYNSAAPGGSATFQSTFSGVSPNGTWTLYAVNWANSPGAGLREITNGWCVTIGTTSDPATTTTVSVSPSPSVLGQSATISATVRNASTNAPVNGLGTVTFKEGNTVLAGPLSVGSNGVASFATSALTQGAHIIEAFYNGSPGSFAVSNGQVQHYVDAPTTNPTAGRFCNSTSLSFPNFVGAAGSPYPTRITTSGLAGTISKVTLELNGLTHQFPDDIDLLLTGPNGNSLIAFSDVGGGNAVNGLNMVLDSTAGSPLPDNLTLSLGTFRPTDFEVGSDSFLTPAPTTNIFSASTTSLGSAFNNSTPNGIWTLWPRVDNAGVQGGGALNSGWCVNITTNQPQLTVSKTHVGNFTQGQTGAQYTVTVGSTGPGSTAGTISLVDNPPSGLTVTGMSGNGWNCVVGTRTCTNSSPIPSGGTLPPITVTVDVANNATSPQVNSVTVSGGGAIGATANDSTIINPGTPDLTVAKSTSSNFFQNGSASYLLLVNNIGSGATTSNFTISDPMPTGLQISSVNGGAGWNCTASTTTNVSCFNNLQLAPNASTAAITVNVTIAANAPPSVTNIATVAGGGQTNTSNDSGSVTSTVTACQLNVVVLNNANSGSGSLRLAVADTCPGGTITFASSVETPVSLSAGQIVLNRNVTIQGPANRALAIRNTAGASSTSRVFTVSSGVTATINGLTMTGGAADNGGGILNQGGVLSLSNATVFGNSASVSGGGIFNQSGILNLSNSTVSGNTASNAGGGIRVDSGLVNLTNVTVSSNNSGNGGGIIISGGNANSRNSLIAGNTAPVSTDIGGTINSQGFNLIGNTSGTTIAGNTTGNVLNQNARLAPVGFYGGTTLTHALLSGSPAINTGDTATSPLFDQRGAARVGPADIGAFELNNTSNGGSFFAALPDGLVNVGYNFTFIPEAGSTTYCLSSGNLPPGMTGLASCLAPLGENAEQLVPTAAVSLGGTPTLGGLYNFAVTATNGGNSNVTNYRLAIVTPTAAGVSVGGRVLTSDGRGVRNATVSITDQSGNTRTVRTGTFGYFRFDEVAAGEVQIVEVSAKRYRFTPQVITPTEELTEITFIGL